MATTYNHAQIGIVDASGNVNVIYPATTGADVSITANSAISSTATTVQALVSALKSGAIYTVSDSTTSPTSGSKYLWSAYKVKSYVDGKITELNSNKCNRFVELFTGYANQNNVYSFNKSNDISNYTLFIILFTNGYQLSSAILTPDNSFRLSSYSSQTYYASAILTISKDNNNFTLSEITMVGYNTLAITIIFGS